MKHDPYIRLFRASFIMVIMSMSFTACTLFDEEEAIPAYLYIEPFTLQINSSAEGSSSSKITEVWVNVGNEFLGAYSLPALVPVLAEGDQEVLLRPGIKDNGIANTPEIYPFYQGFATVRTLAPNKIDTIQPVTSYLNTTKFSLVENFEFEDHRFREVRQGPSIEIVSQGGFENNSARIHLDQDNSVVELGSSELFSDIDNFDIRVYLEVNYRSDVPVIFGLAGRNTGETGFGNPFYQVGFQERSDWNKIYFNLAGITTQQNFDEYRVVLLSALNADPNTSALEEADIWLDNIKLIHF